MAARSKACPSCGALLPGEASFCPHCTRNIRSRRAVRTPSRRWRKRLRMALVLAVAALLAAALYDRFTPDVYSAWGALTYSINGNTER